MSSPITEEVVKELEVLPDNLQRKVLEFVQTLKETRERGVPGTQLLRFAGVIPRQDLERMREAIEAGCERVDVNEW